MNYHNISYPDMNNGSGLRVVLWLSGCNHYCKGCQNSQTWNANSGIPFDELAKKELFEELAKDYISGITFSGGDPLHENNINELFDLIVEIKKKFPNKNIWLYTGYTWKSLFEDDDNLHQICEDQVRRSIMLMCDIVVDGRYIESLRDIGAHWIGSSNQKVIDVKKTIKENKVVLYES